MLFVATMVVLMLLTSGARIFQVLHGIDPDRQIGWMGVALPFGLALWGLRVLLA